MSRIHRHDNELVLRHPFVIQRSLQLDASRLAVDDEHVRRFGQRVVDSTIVRAVSVVGVDDVDRGGEGRVFADGDLDVSDGELRCVIIRVRHADVHL